MPPHCDSMDGPVVRAAARALETGDVDLVVPYVTAAGEDEVRRAFDLAEKARTQGAEAREVADLYFFETVVRIHRAGEGAPFTGLKAAGLDVGPVIPLAERAIETSDATQLVEFLTEAVRREVHRRFDAVVGARSSATGDGIGAARTYVESMLGLEVWAYKLYSAVCAPAHRTVDHPHG